MPQKSKKSKKYKYVEVTWIDAVSVSEWVAPDKLPCPAVIRTRGWLVGENKDHITIAGTLSEDGGYGEVITIPRCWAKIKQLRVK